MSAAFHPEENLILTASLDHTMRVWDFSDLKEKVQKFQGGPNSGSEMYLGTPIEVKHVLDGHEKGLNWAAFHPNRNLMASGADDESIKLWRMSGARAWEMDTLRGHKKNVSCVKFHPKLEILISNSEDKSMKVWDLNRRICIKTISRDTDRYWIVATHPE